VHALSYKYVHSIGLVQQEVPLLLKEQHEDKEGGEEGEEEGEVRVFCNTEILAIQ
jgi:hypothetical protein